MNPFYLVDIKSTLKGQNWGRIDAGDRSETAFLWLRQKAVLSAILCPRIRLYAGKELRSSMEYTFATTMGKCCVEEERRVNRSFDHKFV